MLLGVIWRWLFVAECSTATPLLSFSFAINSIFTGLSLSRFNLSAWMRSKTVECINGIVDSAFLVDIERLGKDDKELADRLKTFSDRVERYTASLKTGSPMWELMRRLLTIVCAGGAFVGMAFEVKNRTGVALVLPYLIFIVAYAISMLSRYVFLKYGFSRLKKAMRNAKTKDRQEFDSNACIAKLKACRNALASVEKN